MKTLTKVPRKTPPFITVKERVARLHKLDLSKIRAKVQRENGWTAKQAKEAEKWYRRFLEAILRFPKRAKFVPNAPIDEFWHCHIMDTRAYARDCEHVFGRFVHHNPYFGVRGKKDLEANQASFCQTNAIYREMFGEDCTMMQHFKVGLSKHNCDSSITCNGQ